MWKYYALLCWKERSVQLDSQAKQHDNVFEQKKNFNVVGSTISNILESKKHFG